MSRRNDGYTIVVLLVAASILVIGLLVAVPVWKTQLQREAEDELIFRGLQYVEAIRRYQTKNPGQFPSSIEELVKKRYLRRPFSDPMTKNGKWDIIVQQDRLARGGSRTPSANLSQLLLVPQDSLASLPNPRILGVVSPSTEKSIRLYNDADTYDKWLFYYGQDAKSKPEIARFGRTEK